MLAFPKPKDMPKLPPKAVLYPEGEGGREVCNRNSAAGRAEYERRKDEMYLRQKKRCSLCGNLMDRENATFEHEDGRGMGGAHQDDRIWKLDPVTGEMKSYNSVAHGWCNGRKGSKRGVDHSLTEGPDFGGRGVLSATAVGAGRGDRRRNRARYTSPLGLGRLDRRS